MLFRKSKTHRDSRMRSWKVERLNPSAKQLDKNSWEHSHFAVKTNPYHRKIVSCDIKGFIYKIVVILLEVHYSTEDLSNFLVA